MFYLKVARCGFQQQFDGKEASRLKVGGVSEKLTYHEGFVCCQQL